MATKPQLQRHRRKSSQPSPTSPTFPRRFFDRPPKIIDPFSPVDSIPTTTGTSNSPSLDSNATSPVAVIQGPQHPRQDGVQQNSRRLPIRLSQEDGRQRPALLGEIERPLTSGAIETKNTFAYNANSSQPATVGRSSPMFNTGRFAGQSERGSQESSRFSSNHSPNPNYYHAVTTIGDRASPDEQVPIKATTAKKSRLNLLNPMSLLARRRSSQNPVENSNLTINTMHVPALPDNFNPSIRGTITHDFSAPRTRRTPSYDHSPYLDLPPRRDSNAAPEKPSPRLQPPTGPTPQSHSPMFKEHFQDDRAASHPGQTASLLNVASQDVSADQLEANMPAFAKRLPTKLPEQAPPKPEAPPPPPPAASREKTVLTIPEEPTSPPPPPPPPKRTPSPKLNMPPASVLPKHMTSTSSRFSFQFGSHASSTQEKLLEEKHKQFQTTKRVSSLHQTDNADDLDYDNYDFDADDIEEEIPEVNFDYDEDGFGGEDEDTIDQSRIDQMMSLQHHSLRSFHFTPQSLTFSPTSTNHASQPTPRDTEGFAIGIADGKNSPEQIRNLEQRPSSTLSDMNSVAFLGGLGISTTQPFHTSSTTETLPPAQRESQTFDDADLYFDDGEFGDELHEASGDNFDEDVFDDESKIRDIPAENARKYEAAIQAAGSDNHVKFAQSQHSSTSDLNGNKSFDTQDDSYSRASRTSSLDQNAASRPGLTEGNLGNLVAYHDLLARAANDAAANGRFGRNVTFEESEDGSQLGLVSDESRFSQPHVSNAIAEDDGFPFDDDMDDDMMIAEANAEALENDDDGFYGQEFGFYARAHSKESTEMVNGGFFTARGSNGVKRSHSGRANFQEPSLTPITERSEWSTRNSVASLQIPGNPLSAQSLPSPGIAQLLELDSPAHDDDMTLSALMKLRRGAFGGSSTSVNSLGERHSSSSPLAHSGPFTFSPQEYSHSRSGSSMQTLIVPAAGIPESEEEDDDRDDEPTLTQNTPMKKMSDPQPRTTQEPVKLPMSDYHEKKKFSHSRNSSGAESVSYARESDGRWVLERRRTGEDGGIEVEKEYVGGRV